MAEGAPLLREYAGKTCIEGSNPSDSARTLKRPFKGRLSFGARASLHGGADAALKRAGRAADGTGWAVPNPAGR